LGREWDAEDESAKVKELGQEQQPPPLLAMPGRGQEP
jgi:hypothetical protein